MMNWLVTNWLTVTLSIVVLVGFSIYNVSLREIRGLKNHILLMLLEPELYTNQKNKLIEFIKLQEARDAYELYSRTSQAISDMMLRKSRAGRTGPPDDVARVAAGLWRAKVVADADISARTD